MRFGIGRACPAVLALCAGCLAQEKFSISGTVTLAGKGQSGIALTLSGAQSAATVTNESGAFTFPNLPAGGNYTVMPAAAGQVFSPALLTAAPLKASQQVEFRIETDVALGKPASQSTTAFTNSPASLAVDGNTDGIFAKGSVTHTGEESNPWWQVDLEDTATISAINIWNRMDCCQDRLADYWVFVSDTPFAPGDTPAALQSRPATWSSHQTIAPNPAASVPVNAKGRYVRVQLGARAMMSLAEVQVLGAAPFHSLAAGKPAAQSSTQPGMRTAGAAGAADGNPDGNFAAGSVTHTNGEPHPWWQVDLGRSAAIRAITIWNRTDCCLDRLGDYWVFVSDAPFAPADTPETLASRRGTWSSHQTTFPRPSARIAVNGPGRYVRVQLSGTNFLSLAEVQVDGGFPRSLAVGKPAAQSSTLAPGTDVAAHAVDGNTDGKLSAGSVSHTFGQPNAWWQVDLEKSVSIGSIRVWNRTDCCRDRLSDYWVFVSDAPFGPKDTPETLEKRAGTWSSHQPAYPDPVTTIPVKAAGRYVRVQLSGNNYLSLAEVEVFGP